MVVIHDSYSKWPEVRAFPRVTSDVVTSYLQELFAHWGLPKSVISDNRPQFSSYEFKEFLRRQGVQHIKTSIFHRQGNRGVERFQCCLKAGFASSSTGRFLGHECYSKNSVILLLCMYLRDEHRQSLCWEDLCISL